MLDLWHWGFKGGMNGKKIYVHRKLQSTGYRVLQDMVEKHVLCLWGLDGGVIMN